jgi:alcohol dehydrogenase (NADP+)
MSAKVLEVVPSDVTLLTTDVSDDETGSVIDTLCMFDRRLLRRPLCRHALCSAHRTSAAGMACSDSSCDFRPAAMQRRSLGPHDVLIDMKYCGVCHSDLHHAANHNMGETSYPCVPGHELAGVCVAVGKDCTKVRLGMRLGVGCIVDACLECKMCRAGEEQKCVKGMVGTYGAKDKFGRAMTPVGWTLGGYTNKFVVNERFAVRGAILLSSP